MYGKGDTNNKSFVLQTSYGAVYMRNDCNKIANVMVVSKAIFKKPQYVEIYFQSSL